MAQDLGSLYRKKAQDGRMGGKEQSGCKLLADADDHYNKEAVEEALQQAKQALNLFKDAGYKSGVPDALRLIVQLMTSQGKKEAAYKMAKDELGAFRSSGDKAAEARMLLAIAEVNFTKDGSKSMQEALQSAIEAGQMFKSLSEPALEATALVALAGVQMSQDGDAKKNAKEAETTATKAKELSIQIGYKKGEAEALHVVAAAQAMDGGIDDALVSADEALDLYLELRNKRGEAFELLSLASWHLKNGKPKKALSDAEEALDIYQTLGSPKEKEALALVFESHMVKGNLAKAGRMVTRGLNKYQESGDKPAEAEALAMLVRLYTEEAKFPEALDAAERAVAIFQDLGEQKLEAGVACKIAEMHLNLGNHDKAMRTSEDAMTLVKEFGSSAEKVDTMFIMLEAILRTGDRDKALDTVQGLRSSFQSAGDAKSEANCLLALSSIQLLLENYDQAVGAATRAQAMFSEDGDTKNEGSALCMLSEAHGRKKEYKMAVKAAERARAVFKEQGDKEGEGASLYRMAANNIQLAVQEGAKVGQEEPLSRAAKDALDKGTKSAEQALKLARELLPQGHQELLGCVLATQSQCFMLNMKPEDALRTSDEAVVLFREIGNVHNEADALLLSADALRVTRQYTESREAADEALALYKQTEDERGEEQVTTLIGFLEEIQQRMQQQWMAQQMAQNPSMFQQQPLMQGSMMMTPAEAGGGMPQQATSLARTDRERGPALDLSSGVDEVIVRGKVLEIAMRITGAEDGEIEADTPLMEAGLTSNSAILMRDELSQELPGVNLPVTLVFDYPSISAMTDLIVESSSKK